MSSRAARFLGPGRGFEITTLTLPDLGANELLVAIDCATICASDLHTYAGRRSVQLPIVLGHEMVGRIAAAGPGGEAWVGQRVVWSILINCEHCEACRRDMAPACENLRKFGHDSSAFMGGFAEHCVLPAGTKIFPVPPVMPDEVAALTICAGATAAAVFRESACAPGDHLVIFGAGLLGLLTCLMATAAGCHVHVVEPDHERATRARALGASTVDQLPPPGAHAVVELSGGGRAANEALGLLRKGGRLVLAGAVFPGPVLEAAADDLVKRQLRISGVYNYTPRDLACALRFLAEPSIAALVRPWVKGHYGLEAIGEAFEYTLRRRPLRTAIYPQEKNA